MLTAVAKYVHHTTAQKEFKNKTTGKSRMGWQTEVSLFSTDLGKTFTMRVISDARPDHMDALQPMAEVYLDLGIKRGQWEDEISLQGVRPISGGKARPTPPAATPKA